MENVSESEEMYVELESQLGLIAAKGLNPLQKMVTALTAIRATLQILREQALAAGFADVASEICFFKVIKPRFFSLQILETELYHLEHRRVAATLEDETASAHAIKPDQLLKSSVSF